MSKIYNLTDDDGKEVTLVVGESGELFNRVKSLGVNVILIGSLKREINSVSDITAIFRLRNIIKEVNPDVIHLHSSKAGTIGRIAAYRLPCKKIFTAHGWPFSDPNIHGLKKKLFVTIEKIMYPAF